MDDLNRSISKHIKTGQYFVDARLWYANKFVYVAVERAYLSIIVICFLIGLSILGLFYTRIDPAASKIPYLITLPDITNQYAKIDYIGDLSKSPQVNVTEYMLKKYVTKRESYNAKAFDDQLKSQVNFIQGTTAPTEYLNYQNYISINNPDSPRMRYQYSNSVDIRIKNITLTNLDKKESQAVVYFDSILYNFMTNQTKTYNMVASISFRIDNINQVIDKKQLNFLVLSYNTRNIKQN